MDAKRDHILDPTAQSVGLKEDSFVCTNAWDILPGQMGFVYILYILKFPKNHS